MGGGSRFYFITILVFATWKAAVGSNVTTIELSVGEKRTILLASISSSYRISSPYRHKIEATCNVSAPSSSASGHIILEQQQLPTTSTDLCLEIEPEFTNDGSAVERFCGSGIVTRYSLFTYMRIGLSGNGTRTAQCDLMVVEAGCECGWGQQAKIVNGIETFPHEYPSVASLLFKPSKHLFCGGTIIAPTYVLTAAHCFQLTPYQKPENVIVLVGFHVKFQPNRYSQTIATQEVIRHAEYRESNQENDIALLKLATSIWYTRGTGPACLPFNYTTEYFFDRDVEMVGWGALSYRGEMSTAYRKVTLTVMPTEICEKKIIWVNGDKLCTFKENKDACQSDSGGPCYFITGKQMIVGIISFGIKCATEAPGVNTSVMKYLNWIETHMESTNFCKV